MDYQRIIEVCKIEDVISKYVKLEYKNDSNLKACCPFHHESTPSFLVEINQKYFLCFGCGVKGNVIKFISEIEKIPYHAAANLLAQLYGLKADIASFELLKQVNDFFKSKILKASAYLFNRKLYKEDWDFWELGYSGDTFDLSKEFKDYKDELVHLGLLNVKNQGTLSEFHPAVLSERVTFPIINYDTPLAFGGRTITGAEIKYINTRDHDFYAKQKTLYGLNKAIKYIKEKDQVIIVEGFIDLIRAHKNEYQNTVSSMSTSLTDHHVQKLSSLTRNVLLFFDRDLGGEEAIKRSCKHLIANGFINIEIGLLPEGEDPDSFLLKQNKFEDAEILNLKAVIKELYTHEEFLSIIKNSKSPHLINQDFLNLYKINLDLIKPNSKNVFYSEKNIKIDRMIQLSMFLDIFPEFMSKLNEDEEDLIEQSKSDPLYIRLKQQNFYKTIKNPEIVFTKLRG